MKRFTKQLLLASLLLLVFGCRTDDAKPNYVIEAEPQYSTVTAEDIPDVVDALNQAINFGASQGSTANLDHVTTPFGEVSMEDIFQVIDSLDNRNYTFKVDDRDNDPFTFTNLVLKKREDGSIDPPYLMVYETDSLHKEVFKSSGFAMNRFTGLIHKRYLQDFSSPQRNTANLGGSYSSIADGCGDSSYALNGEGTIGVINDPGTVNYWNDPTVGDGYLHCEYSIVPVVVRCNCKADLSSQCYCTKYVEKTTCSWIGPSTSVNNGSDCPPRESEEIGINEMSLEDYIRSLSLHEDYLGRDPWTIPAYLWQNGLINPGMAGVIDGFLETINSVYTIGEFILAWNPFNYSTRAMEIRWATWRFVEFLNGVKDDPQFWSQVWNEVKTEFGKYIDDTVGMDAQAVYNQGKLLFDVATLFVGIGEIKAILNGTKFSVAMVSMLQKLPTALSKVVFKAKNLNKLVQKSGDDILIQTTKGSEYVARISGDVMEIIYRGFGGNIKNSVDKTTTLIGRWSNQLEDIWKNGLALQGKNKGGFNILGDPPTGTPEEVWAFNKKWLEDAIARGDDIRVTADPLDINNVYFNRENISSTHFQSMNSLKSYLINISESSRQFEQLGFYGKEIRHLLKNGYEFNPITKQFYK